MSSSVEEQVDLLHKCWAQKWTLQKTALFVYVKLGKALQCKFDKLQFEENVFSVLIMSDKHYNSLTGDHKGPFTIVLKIDKTKIKKNWRNLDEVDYEDLDELIGRMVSLAPFEQGRFLVTLEEPLVRYCAKLRSKYNFHGLKVDRSNIFVDKISMHEHAQRQCIGTAKFMQIVRAEVENPQSAARDILNKLNTPLYVKPRNGCASVGNGILNDEDDLETWISNNAEDANPYVIEELICGQEYTTYAFVFNERVVHRKIFVNQYSVGSFVTKGLPICKLQVVDQSPLYAGLSKYTDKVVNSWKPIENGLFFIQFFLDEKVNFTLLEVCCRMPGGKYAEALWESAGICLEEAHLMANVGQLDEQLLMAKQPALAMFRYPRRKGVVKSLKQPESVGLTSRHIVKWRIKSGDVMEQPRGLAGRHEAVSIILINENYEHLREDYDKLVKHYQPFELD